jgi:thiosulfate/3-mercaptopyruvate sulfurtransferase
MTQQPLVTTGWLAERLGAPDLVVFDATKYLPPSPRDGAADYRAAHIPGARYFDIDVIADPESGLPHTVPSAARFARLVGELGVGNHTLVVFYDQNATMWASRGWWMMRLFGHDRACVLDGGLAKWRREERPIESGDPAPAPAALFRPDLRATRLRGIGDMLANVTGGAELVVDARSAPRFTATAPEIRPGLRGGHIPGSRNLPASELLDADGTLAMSVAGLPEGAVYDGSWTEWGGRPDTPVET